jgi:hypothetical protein
MSLLLADPSKHRHKTAAFWSGSPIGSIGAEVQARQDQATLQCKMGRARIARKCAELRAARPP